jgi:ABC-2 type transport system ATP-binding protein
MSEMALTADHLIVVGRGRLLADTPMADFIAQAAPAVVRVRSPHGTRLREPRSTSTSTRPRPPAPGSTR